MVDIRETNGRTPMLHASVPAKFTMRSDRAQNSRTEGLYLICNCKGHLPHIVVVTAERISNLLASSALGTGNIDYMYHFALPELMQTVCEVGSENAKETLEPLVQGKRLKDISNFPLDLSVGWRIPLRQNGGARLCPISRAKILSGYLVTVLPDPSGLLYLPLRNYWTYPAKEFLCTCHDALLRYGNMRKPRNSIGPEK